ncbi:MAG: Uma2 family endonuclease [Rhodopila sp.]|jgi:Uma2 family endonuclease
MNVALKRPWTTEQFLAWEERQELRYEFDGFQAIAMVGGTAAHSAIQRNLIYALTGGLRGKPCQPHGSELKIRVADRPIRYPDAFVVCTPVPPRATVVSDPVVIFEVLSESSATDDFVKKNAEYRATPSVKRYVVLQQAKTAAVVFLRKGDDWVADLLTGDDAILRMPEIDLDIPLSEIYMGVEFEANEDSAPAEDEAAGES